MFTNKYWTKHSETKNDKPLIKVSVLPVSKSSIFVLEMLEIHAADYQAVINQLRFCNKQKSHTITARSILFLLMNQVHFGSNTLLTKLIAPNYARPEIVIIYYSLWRAAICHSCTMLPKMCICYQSFVRFLLFLRCQVSDRFFLLF